MQIIKKGNSNTENLTYMSFVRPILEYGAACWNQYREGQIIALERVQKKAAEFCTLYGSFELGKFGVA